MILANLIHDGFMLGLGLALASVLLSAVIIAISWIISELFK